MLYTTGMSKPFVTETVKGNANVLSTVLIDSSVDKENHKESLAQWEQAGPWRTADDREVGQLFKGVKLPSLHLQKQSPYNACLYATKYFVSPEHLPDITLV